MKVHIVIGTRPQYVKLAALEGLLRERFSVTVIDTNQHYDEALSKFFLRDLNIRSPEINLRVGSGNHGAVSGKIIIELEKIWLKNRPDAVMVVGDTNSCLGGALAAAKLGISVVHVEAGLRSFEKNLPEEINRVITDHLADILFITEPAAKENLIREGIPDRRIFYAGNVMIDSLRKNLAIARERKIWEKYNLTSRKYGVVTLHRPGNVDSAKKLGEILQAISAGAGDLPLIFPMHLRTKRILKKLRHLPKGMRVTKPLGYLDFISLMTDSRLIITDSGGVQEESSVLGIPCVTLREVTERPITVDKGTNILAGTGRQTIIFAVRRAKQNKIRKVKIPGWDGKAALRIVSALEKWGKERHIYG